MYAADTAAVLPARLHREEANGAGASAPAPAGSKISRCPSPWRRSPRRSSPASSAPQGRCPAGAPFSFWSARQSPASPRFSFRKCLYAADTAAVLPARLHREEANGAGASAPAPAGSKISRCPSPWRRSPRRGSPASSAPQGRCPAGAPFSFWLARQSPASPRFSFGKCLYAADTAAVLPARLHREEANGAGASAPAPAGSKISRCPSPWRRSPRRSSPASSRCPRPSRSGRRP